MRLGDDVVNAGRFRGDAVASAVFTQIFIALEDSVSADFPRASITPFMSTFPCLIVAPAIASMLLSVGFTVAAGIIGYCRAPPVAAWAFRAGRHD